jgi:ankyrin repeat protein
MTPLPLLFLSTLGDYSEQASSLLAAWQAGDQAALDFFHDNLPRFRRDDVAWLPHQRSEAEMRTEIFTLEDAQLAVARKCDFLDWASLSEWVSAIERRDPAVYPFEAAVEAVVQGDSDTLRQLLAANPDLVRQRSARVTHFDPPRHGAMLLHYLAANGVEGDRQKTPQNAVEIMRLLLDAGADPNALASLYGGECSTLSLLVSSAHPAQAGLQGKLAETLIDAGASLAPQGSGNWTDPLMTALVFGRGAEPKTLAAAAGLNRIDLVKGHLESGKADPLQPALALAAHLGHSEIVKLLLAAGADPNQYNPDGMQSHSTPLHQAALAGHVEVVRTMLEAPGVRLDIQDKIYDGTPLDWALHGERHEVADLLRAQSGQMA